jgi:glutathione peroxidase
LNYQTEFPRFKKVDVNGENEDPLFAFLKSQKGFAGFNLETKLGPILDKMFREKDPNYAESPDIKWNFTKFLIDREGNVVERFEPTSEPEEIAERVKELL